MSEGGTLDRALAALRTGRTVRIDGTTPLVAASVETISEGALDALDPTRDARLLISGARAAALSLANLRDAADPGRPVLLNRLPWLGRKEALDLADPGRDFDRAPMGPLQPTRLDDPDIAMAALSLARLAGLLPALWVLGDVAIAETVAFDTIARANVGATLVARARLPLDGMPDTQIVVFRGSDDGQEHAALIIGSFAGQSPLVRLHSECLTGDVFGSLKCDCGAQLREALRIIGDAGGGVLLYLRQEGRGIGLANKIRAYALQDRGFDTVDANRRLGFSDDERDYGHAAAMLRALGIDRVRLLTNNPAKRDGLEAHGIAVVERVAHRMPANPHNADYLETKRTRSGHLD